MEEVQRNWSNAVSALVRLPDVETLTTGIKDIISLYADNSEKFLQHEAKYEQFYSSVVGLTVNYVTLYCCKGLPQVDLNKVLKTVLIFLIERIPGSCEECVIASMDAAQMIHYLTHLSFTTDYTKWQGQLVTYESALGTCNYPDYVKKEEVELSPDTTDSRMSVACGDFLKDLSQFTMATKSPEQGPNAMHNTQFMLDVNHAFQEVQGPARLLKALLSLPLLAVHRDAVTRLLSSSGLALPSTEQEAELLVAGLSPLTDQLKVVQICLSNPALYFAPEVKVDKSFQTKIMHSMMACTHVACYAAVCTTLPGTPNADVEQAALQLISLSMRIVSQELLQFEKPLLHVKLNILSMCAWVLIQTIDNLNNKTQKLPKSTPRNTYWNTVTVLLTKEFHSLLEIISAEMPKRTSGPAKFAPKTSGEKLAEAKRFSTKNFDVKQEYTLLELFKFMSNGCPKLPELLCTASTNLVERYKESVAEPSPPAPPLTPPTTEPLAHSESAPEMEEEELLQPESAHLRTLLSYSADENDILTSLFEERYKSGSPTDTPPNEPLSACFQPFGDVALLLIAFLDKSVIINESMKELLTEQFSKSKTQHALSQLATLVNSISFECRSDTMARMSVVVRSTCKHMVQRGILDRQAQEGLLLLIGLYPDKLITSWPMYVHPNKLYMLLEIVLSWTEADDWDERETVVVDMWEHFLTSLHSECLTATHDGDQMDDVNLEHCQIMLTLLYTLLGKNKQAVFICLAKTIMQVMKSPRDQLVTMIPLPVTRLFLLLEYMLTTLFAPPNALHRQIKHNVLGRTDAWPESFPEGDIDRRYDEHSEKRKSPTFYRLCEGEPEKQHHIDPIVMSVLTAGEEHELDVSEFYKLCLDGLLVGSSLDKSKPVSKLMWFDSACTEYHIKVMWRVLDLLPPPPSFLLQMTDVHTLASQPAAIQALRIAPKLQDSEYVTWYKKSLQGVMQQSEIDGLIESVVNKTESPMYEVDITLHLIQAQMAVMMFGSQDEVISTDQMPGFLTILSLDLVFSHLHSSLVRFLHKQPHDNAAESLTEPPLDQLKDVAEKLMPALLLLTGSLTQFVRSQFIHDATESRSTPDVEDSSFTTMLNQLNSISSSNTLLNCDKEFIPNILELKSTLKRWEKTDFSDYPEISWLPVDKKSNRSCDSATHTTAVLSAAASSLSSNERTPWYTTLALRHLHLSILNILYDIYGSFGEKQDFSNSDDLERTFVPLLFDGSCTLVQEQAVACLEPVINYPKLIEVKYLYLLRKWYTVMLDLNAYAPKISKETCENLTNSFSRFMQSGFTHTTKEVTSLMADFFTTKADLSALLLVTGMPGCSDMISINNILRIFTKLISLVGSQSDGPLADMLRALNALSRTKEAVLCQWLQRIVMATPNELEDNDTNSQIEKNSLLLHTIADYMVKEDGLIDKAVPDAILQSLIVVAGQVLHETLNAQGFQELMLVMSTLSRSGQVISLVRAVIGWLESCIPHLIPESKKYKLYSELTGCLLQFLNNSLTIVMGKQIDEELTEEMEVENEEEEANSENPRDDTLDNMLCTFTQTQRDFKTQHWYHCYTCKMTDGVGVCSVCVKVCHKDHDVSYAKHGSFFCDCGAKEDNSCVAMKKRSVSSTQSKITHFLKTSDAKSKQTVKNLLQIQSLKQSASLAPLIKENKAELIALMEQADLKQIITNLLQVLEPEYLQRYSDMMPQAAAAKVKELHRRLQTEPRTLEVSESLMQPTGSSQENVFDNLKQSFSGDQGQTIKQLVNSHMIRREVMCLLSSPNGKRPLLAVCNDKSKIVLAQVPSLFKHVESQRKRWSLSKLPSVTLSFAVLSLASNAEDEDLLAVCGLRECHILCLNSGGAVTKQISLPADLDTGNFIVKAVWLPGSNSKIAVVTADFIKVYSLHDDMISPTYYFLLPAGKIRDVTFSVDPESSITSILVMSSSGPVYLQPVNAECMAENGPFYITTTLDVPHGDMTSAGRVTNNGGASIHYSHALGMLFLSYMNGLTLAGAFNSSPGSLTNLTRVILSKGKANASQPMIAWSEVDGHPGLVYAVTQSTNNPVCLYITPGSIGLQELKASVFMKSSNKNGKVLDYLSLKNTSQMAKRSTFTVLLCEDGSLKVYQIKDSVGMWTAPELNPPSPFTVAKCTKKKSSKKSPSSPTLMPIDFFEQCAVTADVEFGGNDILEVYNRELIKKRFETPTQYIACTRPDSFKLEVINTNSNSVIVGLRILIGSHQLNRIPRYIEVLGRQKTISTDCPRWLDFPFTPAEARQAAAKITITFGASADPDSVTMIDSVRAYSQTKERFGWTDEVVTAERPQDIESKTGTSVEPDQSALPEERILTLLAVTHADKLLASSIETLLSYLKCNPGSVQSTDSIERSLCSLLRLIIPGVVRKPALTLLHEIKSHEQSSYIDKLRCDMMREWMNLTPQLLDPRTYQLTLDWLVSLGSQRPASLLFLNPRQDDGVEKEFLERLVEFFTTLHARRPRSARLALACCPGLQNVRSTISSLVDVMFLLLNEKPDLLEFINKLCINLLFSKDSMISFACKQALVRILKPPATFTKIPETPVPETPQVDGGQDEMTPTPARSNQPADAPEPSAPRNVAMPVPPEVADLQQWLDEEQVGTGMMEDIQLALALSLQDAEGMDEEDDDDDDDDDDEDDEEEDEEEEVMDPLGDEEVEDLINHSDLYMNPNMPAENADAPESDDDSPTTPGAPRHPPQGDVDSDAHLSAHSSTEGVQNVGISEPVTPGETAGRRELRHRIRLALLAHGVERLETSSGLDAIPYLQVLSLLFTDLNEEEHRGTLEAGLNGLMKLVDFSVTPEQFSQRTPQTEVQLIILRLCSVLMSRSHNAAGATGAVLNTTTATILINKHAPDFFLPLLQLLLKFWERYDVMTEESVSPLLASTSACKYDMTPFFLKQYVKEHAGDVFAEFAQLQTEMVLRLVHQMKRVSDSNSNTPQIVLGDAWNRTLSEYMGVCKLNFIRRQVKKLLNYLCGNKENYRRVRDYNTIDINMNRVRSIAQRNGVPENPDITTFTGLKAAISLSYPTLLETVDSLKVIQDIVTSRNSNWQLYCLEHATTLPLLMLLSIQISEGVTDTLLTLITNLFTLPKAPSNADKEVFEELLNRLLQPSNHDLLTEFMRVFLLQNNQTSIRKQAHGLVFNLYENSTQAQKDFILTILWQHWQNLSSYGKKGGMYVDLVGYMLIKTDMSDEKRQEYIDGIAELLSTNNSHLFKHQNTNIYNMLQEIVDLEGYYLEHDPCVACSDPEVNFSTHKLNNVKVDTKFTTTTQMIKLTGNYQIAKISMKISEIKKRKMIKTIKVFYTNKTVQSAVELKNRTTVWQQAKVMQLSSSQSDVRMEFPVPITACNLMIEYSDFYENMQGSQENLQCPRCSATVGSTLGICGNCGENVFQCHKCRSINYDEREPFLCNTCGFCKYGKFDVVLTAKPCCAVDPIESDADRTKTLANVNSLLEKADGIFSNIQASRSTLEKLLVQFSGSLSDVPPVVESATDISSHVNRVIRQVANKYCNVTKKEFEELSKAMQKVMMCRRELLEFDRQQQTVPISVTPSSASVSSQMYIQEQYEAAQIQLDEQKRLSQLLQRTKHTNCYGCLSATVGHCVTILRALATQPFCPTDETLITELVSHNLNSGPMSLRHDTMRLLCSLTQASVAGSQYLHELIYKRIHAAMSFCSSTVSLSMNVRAEMLLLSNSITASSPAWEERMRTVIRLYTEALNSGKSHVIESVALRCLEIIKSQIITAKPTSNKNKSMKLEDLAGFSVDPNQSSIDVTAWLEGRTSMDQWKARQRRVGSAGEDEADGAAVNPLERKYFSRWVRNVERRGTAGLMINTRSWIAQLLFSQSCQSAREISSEILLSVSGLSERRLILVDFLSKLLPQITSTGGNANDFINLYKSLIEPPEVKYYLVLRHDILRVLADLISQEISKISQLEARTLGSDLSLGWGLQSLVSTLKEFIDDGLIRARYKNKLVGPVLDGYLSLKQLVVQRTKMIERTQELLLNLLEMLTTGNEQESREFMAVCVQTLNKYSPTDLRSPVFIFERLSSLIRPEESGVGEFLMTLDKDPNQEDFLQGRMPGNPYSSKEPGLGPLMRDIKNKICTDCELVALLEDDSGMELLVNNKIMSLDLEVADVYRKIWLPARENEPMRIVYRMRGLLGDATEDMVNSLSTNIAEQQDEELVYKMAAVMAECGGLDVMLRRLAYVHDYVRGQQLVAVLLKLFDLCLRLKVNREALIRPDKDTISVMLRALNRALRAEQAVSTTPQVPGQSNTEKVLQIMETVLSQASHLPEDEYTEFTKRCGDSDQLMLLLDRINSPFVRYNSSVLEALMKLIPFLACGEQEKMNTLIKYFKPYLNFPQFDIKRDENDVIHLDCFCVITSGIKSNLNGSKLKQTMIDSKVLEDAVNYITWLAPPVKTLLATDADDWKEFVDRSALPYVLKLINGMCSGNETSQKVVGDSMIPILHKLEHLSTHSQIGTLAENVMETLRQNASVSERIDDIRAQTKAEKKRLAMAVREKQLQSIGMKTNNKGQVIVSSAIMKEAGVIEEETGLICSICREGYLNQPSKVLAIYTFTKRANLENFETRSRKVPGLSTVSHMNIVHIDCHTSAVRLASGGRDEWDSAALHNSNSRCNSMLPLWGPAVAESAFATALARRTADLNECTGLHDESYTYTAHDVKLLLLKFCGEQPFSTDGTGGGRNSNMLLVPYQLLLALYVINSQTSSAKSAALKSSIDGPKTKWVESSYDIDGPLYWGILALLFWKAEVWKEHRIRYLERLLVLSQARSISPGGANSLKDKTVKPYAVYKQNLVLFGLIDLFYSCMFKAVSSDGDWPANLIEYIRNHDEALAVSSEKMVKVYESELLPCESLSEMFDVLGLLGEVVDPDSWLADLLQSIE